MTNYLQAGDALTFTAPSGGVVSGHPKQIGRLLVVPTVTAAQTERFVGLTKGVFSVTKVDSQAWAEGAVVYWDSGNNRFTTTASTHLQAGTAVEAVGSGSGETTGVVRLDGIARAAA